MREIRVHVGETPAGGALLTLDGAASHHLAGVLRLACGQPLTLFDGSGREWTATVESISRRGAIVRVGEARCVDRESALAVHLVQGISRGERMDYTLQKAVELGVRSIRPVFTERSTVQLDGERALRRQGHWRGIIEAACAQCGRNRLPELHEAATLATTLQALRTGPRLVLRGDATSGLAAVVDDIGDEGVTLLAGPEGGLSEGEHALALSLGWRGLRLGPRVLRTETAALAAIAALQALRGDFRD